MGDVVYYLLWQRLTAVIRPGNRAAKGVLGALAQLVERTTSCASPAPTPQVGELAQKINTKFGALAQLVARYIRIVEVTGSNPVCSTSNLPT